MKLAKNFTLGLCSLLIGFSASAQEIESPFINSSVVLAKNTLVRANSIETIAEDAYAVERVALKSMATEVRFRPGTAALMTASLADLEEIYLVLSQNQELEIEIKGFSGEQSSDGDYGIMSHNQAEAVRGWLFRKGIELERMNIGKSLSGGSDSGVRINVLN